MKLAVSCAKALLVTVAVAGFLRGAAPPARMNPARVRVLLRKLDADNFFTRQRADEALRGLGKPVLPLLRAERQRTTSLEVRDRLDRMMRDLTFDEQVADLVRMLGHASRENRDQADQVLRRSGPAVVPLLKKELKGELDGRCRARLEKIIAELSGQRP
jgi:hypothetical protein